jgi:hypothetical protein
MINKWEFFNPRGRGVFSLLIKFSRIFLFFIDPSGGYKILGIFGLLAFDFSFF